jgi:hypothetical protein
VTRLKWKLGSVRLEIVLLLMHNWCTVCVKRTIGLEIVLEHPMELLVDVGLVESRFDQFETVLASVQDRCSVCVKRTIGS